MIASLRKIVTGKSDVPTIEVEIVETCMIGGKHTEAGTKLELPATDAELLIGNGRATRILSAEAKTRAEYLKNLIPPPWTARELPELWESLPKCFHELWTLTERFRCVYGRADEIEKCYLMRRGITNEERRQIELETSRSAPDGTTRSALLDSWIHHRTRCAMNFEVLTDDRREELRKISDAVNRAYQAINDLNREEAESFIRLRLEAGAAVLAEIQRGSKAARESSETGFEIFRQRIEPLGLGVAETRRLYQGTREMLAYQKNELSPPNLRLGWHDQETGEHFHYIEGEPETLASYWRMFHERADELEAVAKAAKAELSRTRKASAAA